MTPDIIKVELGGRGYDIVVSGGLLSGAGGRLRPLLKSRRVIAVTDENVARLHLSPLLASLEAAGIAHDEVILPPGEKTKSFHGLEKLLEEILVLKPERSVTLVALGGGVIGDITGFAASIMLRGVDFIQIPTTLLAMVDSSVGGKTGINTRHGKNLVGTFYQPRLVLADTDTLATLDKGQWLAGYAEIVKYGLIDDPAFFEWLEKAERGAEAVRRMIVHSCRAKARIVAEDERESGKRALLNLGHTFGHALEAETGYELLHGHAVAIGMAMAFDFSARLGLCPPEDAARVKSHLRNAGLPVSPREVLKELAPERLLSYMRQDKKVRQGRIVLILARGAGKAFIASDIEEKSVLDFLESDQC